jgi:hypothetical protein
MNCYCQQIFFKDYKSIYVTFEEFNKDDKTQYCNLWYPQYLQYFSIQKLIPVAILFINVVVSVIFNFIGPLGKYHSVND